MVINVGVAVQETPEQVVVGVSHGGEGQCVAEGRPPGRIYGVGIRACVEQRPHDRGAASDGRRCGGYGPVQRRAPAPVDGMHAAMAIHAQRGGDDTALAVVQRDGGVQVHLPVAETGRRRRVGRRPSDHHRRCGGGDNTDELSRPREARPNVLVTVGGSGQRHEQRAQRNIERGDACARADLGSIESGGSTTAGRRLSGATLTRLPAPLWSTACTSAPER